jgi:hypothetical protein
MGKMMAVSAGSTISFCAHARADIHAAAVIRIALFLQKAGNLLELPADFDHDALRAARPTAFIVTREKRNGSAPP